MFDIVYHDSDRPIKSIRMEELDFDHELFISLTEGGQVNIKVRGRFSGKIYSTLLISKSDFVRLAELVARLE